MIKKIIRMGLVASLALLCTVGVGNALIVDLNSYTNTVANPFVVPLTAGTYDVTPIGVADGGAFNAWNAWGYVNLPDQGWINNYSLSSNEFAPYGVSDGVRYATDLLALENALATSFTLASAGNVNFYIGDSNYDDNIGGMSLFVTQRTPVPEPPNGVPEPTTLLFLAVGLAGIVGFGKKYRK